MDLTQSKLTRNEWEAIEVPVTPDELRVGQLLLDGATDPLVKRNRATSLGSFLQIAKTPATSEFFWTKYILPELSAGKNGCSKSAPIVHGIGVTTKECRAPALGGADRIRLRNADRTLSCPSKRSKIFEFILVDLVKEVCHARVHGGPGDWLAPYYALRSIRTRSVRGVHNKLIDEINALVSRLDPEVDIRHLVLHSSSCIERNNALLLHADDQLFDHQRRLLSAVSPMDSVPRLILLTAPTGTGKTVAPVGLSQVRRVVFVCAARHVGLALAKLGVSLQKKVAFAFGCDTEEDIRLHYYAATDCIRSRRSGKIVKVDNTAGEEVEIMICDVRSCSLASRFMARFNKTSEMVLYWDEPTIALDYPDHPCHPIIRATWENNEIPCVVLSSATLPTVEELAPTVSDFKRRFPGAEVIPIESHECRKSIPLLARDGEPVMPHDLGSTKRSGTAAAAEMAAARALANRTLFRHIALGPAAAFIRECKVCTEDITTAFPDVDSVTSESVKACYLECVRSAASKHDQATFDRLCAAAATGGPMSTARVMTSDAHTLTDGPTIFLADDVDKIARFFIKDAALPADVLRRLGKCISHNEALRRKIDAMQMAYDDSTPKDAGKGRDKVTPAMAKISKNMDALRGLLRPASIGKEYIPNTKEHLTKHGAGPGSGAYAPDINEAEVEAAMLVEGVDDKWKLLLLLGVGVFAPWNTASYTELMKRLAQEQKLFLVVATSDYIYGTNYQFCHGYIAKDLGAMTQEKCIQAMGRVGRNRLQQTYSIRFRDDGLIRRLYSVEDERPEVENMARLFCSGKTV